jgi:hypothetical protein
MANRWRDMAVQLYTLRPMNFDFRLLTFDLHFAVLVHNGVNKP